MSAAHAAVEHVDRTNEARSRSADAGVPTAAAAAVPLRFAYLQRTAGNHAVAQLVRQGHLHSIQRCGGVPCACSVEERAEKEGYVQRDAKDVPELDQRLDSALGQSDWPRAAEILNAFALDDIRARLEGPKRKLSKGVIGAIHAGALANAQVGPDSQVAIVTRPTYLDLNFDNSVRQRNFKDAARFLNAFNKDDIERRLQGRAREQVQSLHDGAVQEASVGDKSQVAILTQQLLNSMPVAPTSAPVACPTAFGKATSFQALIDLVRAAEKKLAAAGTSSPRDQIHALRGLFYGTTWSQDYSVEKSTLRNEGFQRFTRPSEDPSKSVPPDISALLDCGLADALKQSQDVVDPGGRHVDFGHLLIGLDARFDPKVADKVNYPVAGGLVSINMGGTGTELVTWLGDLGGGAARLAILRSTTPSTSASNVFTGSDYGGSINLEGDVAAADVASGGSSKIGTPVIAAGKGLSDALQDYLSPAAPSAAWTGRAKTFLGYYGGVLDASGALTNRSTLIASFASQMQEFACNYLASRVKDSHITKKAAQAAASHVVPASEEVAEAFVDALVDSAASGAKIEAKRFPAPKPARPGACAAQITAASLVSPF